MSDDYEFIMLTTEGCSHCTEAKNRLKDRIDSGEITVMDVSKDNKALDLANKHGVDSVPTVIINNKATECPHPSVFG